MLSSRLPDEPKLTTCSRVLILLGKVGWNYTIASKRKSQSVSSRKQKANTFLLILTPSFSLTGLKQKLRVNKEYNAISV
jgi:hypothetical protein